jgi:3-oxoacyl-[acyl-carrier protein] reductase
MGLRGLTAIVTGGSQGLGRASALALARNGAKVCISARNAEDAATAAEAIGAECGQPDNVFALRADATKQKDIDSVFGAVIDRWGQLDILVSNVGGPKPGTYQQLTPEDWEEASNQTLMSFVRACYTVTPHMIERGTGSIVTIQSLTVKQGIDNLVLSNSIRLANVGLVRSMATELGPLGIRVNSINPGMHMTDRLMATMQDRAEKRGLPVDDVIREAAAGTPLRRIGDPEKFGENVAWLASPAASFITGQAMMVDGGVVKSPL